MKTASKVLAMFLLSVFAGMGFADDEIEPVRAADLLTPVRIMAAGEPLVVESRLPALTMGDFNNNGKLDLFVGEMTEGQLRIYLNIGTAGQPKFGEATDFMAGGKRACVPSGCYTSFSPQLVDFDGDGRTDILSSSFNSGIFLFRHTEDEKFAEAEMLDDRHGRPIEFRYNGAALAYDWDADGDLDLLAKGLVTAERRSYVNLIINEGSRRNPAYGELQRLTAGGKPITAKPCAVVDWDGDGKDDLLTLAGDVCWHRNTGEKGKPVLQPEEILVPSRSYHRIERRPEEPRRIPGEPSRITSVCATDVNSDGRLDLLAVDMWSEDVDLPERTDQQQAAKEDLGARVRSLREKYQELSETPENESLEARVQRRREFLRTWKESAALSAELSKFSSYRAYGSVWLFERTGH